MKWASLVPPFLRRSDPDITQEVLSTLSSLTTRLERAVTDLENETRLRHGA